MINNETSSLKLSKQLSNVNKFAIKYTKSFETIKSNKLKLTFKLSYITKNQDSKYLNNDVFKGISFVSN